MSEPAWWRRLNGDPTRFLLDGSEPGVVWRTLVELVARPADSAAVVRARAEARLRGAACDLLASQQPLGYWGSPHGYGARWGGTAWQVIAVAALGGDGEDPRVERGAQTLLGLLLPRSGGFATAPGRPPSACFTAETCAALARLGFLHHPRVREAIGWLTEREGGAGGWSCPDLRHLVGGSCPIASVATLRLVAELPVEERRLREHLRERGVEALLSRSLWMGGDGPRGWHQASHPCLGRTDLLDALAALARAGCAPSGDVFAAVREVLTWQDRKGCWSHRARVPFGEPVGAASRWLTLKALVVLAAYGEQLEGAEAPG